MQLTSIRDPRTFWIDWWLINHCNYNCSYCADIIKNGSVDWPDIKHCETTVAEIASHCGSLGRVAEYYFTGGEVTVWPFLTDLLRACQQHDARTRIRTNASMDLDQWQSLLPYVNSVTMEFHSEHGSVSHFLLLLKAARVHGCAVSVNVSMQPQRWQELEAMCDQIQRLWPDQSVTKKLLFHNPAVNTQPMHYEPDQIKRLLRQQGNLELTLDTGEVIATDYTTLVLENNNQFNGWQCRVGLEQIVIDAWGRIYRGHCRARGTIGHLGQKINWPQEPVTCGVYQCRNGFDILATKIKD